MSPFRDSIRMAIFQKIFNENTDLTEHAIGISNILNEYTNKLVFISSESVYSGIPNSNEESNLAPGTVYAKSKLKAENYLKLDSGKNISIRTTIVGSKLREPHSGFIDWIINSVGQDKEIDLYEDNRFSPITIWKLSQEIEYLLNNWNHGIWNISGKEAISKYEFGYKLALKMKFNTERIKKGKLADKVGTIKRSLDQSIDSSKYERMSGRTMPNIDDTIEDIYEHLQQKTSHES